MIDRWDAPLPSDVIARIERGDSLLLPGMKLWVPGGTDAVHVLSRETGCTLRTAFLRLVRVHDGASVTDEELDSAAEEWPDEAVA